MKGKRIVLILGGLAALAILGFVGLMIYVTTQPEFAEQMAKRKAEREAAKEAAAVSASTVKPSEDPVDPKETVLAVRRALIAQDAACDSVVTEAAALIDARMKLPASQRGAVPPSVVQATLTCERAKAEIRDIDVPASLPMGIRKSLEEARESLAQGAFEKANYLSLIHSYATTANAADAETAKKRMAAANAHVKSASLSMANAMLAAKVDLKEIE